MHDYLGAALMSGPDSSRISARELEEAVAECGLAARLRPDQPRFRHHLAVAQNNLAVVLAAAGQLGAARRHWEEAAALEPGYEDPRRNLGILERASASP